jgi:hypothetical protein
MRLFIKFAEEFMHFFEVLALYVPVIRLGLEVHDERVG